MKRPSDQMLLFAEGFTVGDLVYASWNKNYTGKIIAISKKYSLILEVAWDFGGLTRLLATSVNQS
jgi:hypothetical protein